MEIRDLILAYVKIRDKKAKLKNKHTTEMAPFNETLSKLESVFMSEMDRIGADSVSANDCGTVYRSTHTSASVADFDALKAFVIEHDAWELLQGRVSAVAVGAYLDDTGELPPGVSVSRMIKIGVRKA